MATPNYSYEKRQRELAKKRKAEEKRQKKLVKSDDAPAEQGSDGGTDRSDQPAQNPPPSPSE